MPSHIVGYPRMGPERELKFALESFWDGKSSAEDLQKVSADLRSSIWKQMADARIKHIPSNTFSYYDQVLDTTALLGAVPPRYGWNGGEIGFDTYFSMARGNASVPAMEMTKWFDTNYHFIVPELGPDVNFSYASHKAVEEYKEAKALGVDTVPVLVGPVSYLLLSKPAKGVEKTFSLLSLLPKILPIYKEVVSELKAAGASWIQFDEPTLVLDLESDKLQAFTGAYSELESALSGLNVLIKTYSAHVPAAAFKTLTSLKGVTAYGFDLVRGTKTLDLITSEFPKGKYLFAGVVDGRNIWANDLSASLNTLKTLEGIVGKDKLVVSTSTSLLHTAVDLVNDEDGSYFGGLYLYALRGVKQHMHKVPEKFRKGNEEFYRSRVVTIGLCHDFDAHLRCAGLKLQYLEAFVARYSCSEDHLKELGRRLGERARDYNYWAPFEQIPGDIGTMMLVDGVFLLELMLRSRFPEYRKAGDDDPIFNSRRIIVDVCRDILLMENQIPWIVLEELYQQFVVPRPRPEHVSLPQLVHHFFNAHLFDNNNIPPTPTDGDEFQFDHLVAFVRSFYSPRPKSSPSSSASDGDNYRRSSNNVNDTIITVQLIPPSVSKLYEAGVKLEKLFSASSGLNIGFDKGRLKIPHLDYWTGTFFLNVMVFEENEDFLIPSGGQYVSQFMFFMGWMIRTSKDVDIIIESEIISSMLGSNTELVALFDRISKMGWPHDYFDLCQELNDYCTSSPWHKWKVTLKRDYFDTPWKIASTIAAVLGLPLVLIQTVFAFL